MVIMMKKMMKMVMMNNMDDDSHDIVVVVLVIVVWVLNRHLLAIASLTCHPPWESIPLYRACRDAPLTVTIAIVTVGDPGDLPYKP